MLNEPEPRKDSSRHVRLEGRRWHLVFFIFVVLVCAVYVIGVPRTPPGFCLDESSIAFNAHLIATTGHDEYRVSWPLYFRAFGEYKNPIYIYLLAFVFKITGPSIAVARSLSAILGVLAVLLISYLAATVSERKDVGTAVGLSAALTPWLYQNSRLVFEVALYPAVVTLVLIAVWRASKRARWSLIDIASLIATLALLTYAYSIGRLLGPLFALGLVIFARRTRYREILIVWFGYAVTLIPLLIFNRRHSGALAARFDQLTYIQPNTSVVEIIRQFITQYLRDINPMRMLLTGEDNVRDNLLGTGGILFATFVLALAGLCLILRRERKNSWWLYVMYAFIVSIIPAALTTTIFPQIRLIALPVIINVVSIPAWQFLFSRAKLKRPVAAFLFASVLLIVAQGGYFQILYHRTAPERGYICDDKFPRKVLSAALATLQSRIYLFDPPGKSGYVQSYWHGLLGGIDPSRFVRLTNETPPPGTVVISSEETCLNCRLLARHLNFIVYTRLPSELQARSGPLSDEAFRADIKLARALPSFRIREQRNVTVFVRNVSSVTWPSVGNDHGRYSMTVRSRWLKPDGTIAGDSQEGTPIFYGLDPGDLVGITLPVIAPDAAGEYQLLIDVVQEGVNWFSEKGSKPLVSNVSVMQ
jgi:4-amino-4-deoxy-L-arabinose transferase-like glycosyltransferase